jgi:hypothetical protein
MTYFRSNNFGITSDIDYKKLNSFASNDIVVKEVVDLNAKGIVAWQKIAKTTLRQEPSGATPQFQPLTGMKDLKFYVQKNRFINIVFYPLSIDISYMSQPAEASPGQELELHFSFSIDNAMSGTLANPQNIYGQSPSSPNEGPTTYSPTHTSALSEGEHTLSVMFKFGDPGYFGALAELNDGALLIVEDLGERNITPVIIA